MDCCTLFADAEFATAAAGTADVPQASSTQSDKALSWPPCGPSQHSGNIWSPRMMLVGAALAGAAAVYLSGQGKDSVVADVAEATDEQLQQLVNWSGTHRIRPKRFFQPETTQEVEDIVKDAHEKGKLLCQRLLLLRMGLRALVPRSPGY